METYCKLSATSEELFVIMKIGILGGTFNPPHIGHLILAQTAKDVLQLDKVFFVPTNTSPHKGRCFVSAGARLEMVKMAIKGCPYFKALDWEIKRKGVSYTIDTLYEMRSKYPEAELFVIIGSDLADTFHTWKDYRKIQSLSKIVVAKRNGHPLRNSGEFATLDIINIEVTSSLVRKYLKEGLSVRYLLPREVFDYIGKNNLYTNHTLQAASHKPQASGCKPQKRRKYTKL